MNDDVSAAPPTHGAWTPDGETPPPAPAVSEDAIITMLKTVFDPEIPVDIYELGLIYAVEIEDDGKVKVELALARGKQSHDKRQDLARRDAQREVVRELGRRAKGKS